MSDDYRNENLNETGSEPENGTNSDGLNDSTENKNADSGMTGEENKTADQQQIPETPAMQDGNYSYAWNGDNCVKKKRHSGKKIVALVIAATLLLTALAFGAGVLASKNSPSDDSSAISNSGYVDTNGDASTATSSREEAPQVITQTPTSGEYSSDLSALYEKCSQSCATIYVTKQGGYSIGSGFVVSKDGYIVTNHHVIDSGSKIEVIFYDGTKYTAELVGSDSLSDIAVLSIKADNLVPIEIGDSSTLKVGDAVVAIGTPYSTTLAGTMTTGIISGVNRSVDVTNDYGTKTKTMILLQTDSSINPGNSGGPLINMYGQVIGINSLKLMSSYEGIGFAIPISSAVKIINELIAYGTVTDIPSELVTATPKLNITIAAVNDDVKSQYYLPDDVPQGVLVLQLSRSSSVYKAGLELYDIITEFNGTAVTSNQDMSDILSKLSAGQTVTMKVYRTSRSGNGTYIDLTFVLDAAS